MFSHLAPTLPTFLSLSPPYAIISLLRISGLPFLILLTVYSNLKLTIAGNFELVIFPVYGLILAVNVFLVLISINLINLLCILCSLSTSKHFPLFTESDAFWKPVNEIAYFL